MAGNLLQSLDYPDSLPDLSDAKLESELPMAKILVDDATLVQALVVSYQPTEIVGDVGPGRRPKNGGPQSSPNWGWAARFGQSWVILRLVRPRLTEGFFLPFGYV